MILENNKNKRMTTKEVYFKVNVLSELPVARLYFTLKDDNGVVQLWGGSLCLDFHNDNEDNIKLMQDMEKIKGFMFWNNSDEGEKWYKENWNMIGKSLSNMVLNQK